MTSPDFTAVGDFFRANSHFAIFSHVRPDGDAYGSSLGLGLCLRAMGKTVRVFNEDGLLPMFDFLPGSSTLLRTSGAAPGASEKIIAVDTSTADRLGPSFQAWKLVPDLNIDHHVSNPAFAALNCIVPDAPATAQVLYDLIQKNGLPCTADVASNLFVGISTDTGSFRYRQTTAHTFAVATALVQAGADAAGLARNCYQNYSTQRLQLLREALNTMHLGCNGRLGYIHLDSAMFARTGAEASETEGLLEQLQAVRDFEVVFLVEEMEGGLYRVSLRSRDRVDVQAIASQFGGGGHRLAAGLRSRLSLPELESRLIAAVGTALDAEN